MAWQDRGPIQIQKKSKKKDSFLAGLLPTGGGIGGALGGAAIGAAAGSAVPVVGTAIGGLLGAVLGGAAGSGVGKTAENAIEGNENLGEGVLQESLIGGATSLPFTAGLKVLKAGGKVATGIGKTSARDLLTEAGTQTIGKKAATQYGLNIGDNAASTAGASALKSSTSGRLKTAGDKALLNQYGTISKPFSRSTDPAGTISTLADAGITRPVDAERVASAFTGTDGIVTKLTADAVGKAGNVNIDSVSRVFKDAVENTGLVDKDAASVTKIFNAQMNRLRGGSQGSIATEFNPTEVLSVMKSLEKRVANLRGKGDNYRLSTPEREDQASVLQLVRDELEDSLYQGAGANAKLTDVLTPEARASLVDLFPDNPKWANYVDTNVMGAKSVADLRSSAAPLVRVGKIIDEGESNAITYGGRVGNAFAGGGVKDMIGTAVTGLVKNPASRAAGNALRGASDIAGGAASKQAGSQSLLGLTARQGLPRAAMGLQPGEDPSTLEGVLANEQSYGDMGMQEEQTAPMENPVGYSSEELGNAYMQALSVGDEPAAKALSQMYELATQFEEQSQAAAPTAVTQKALSATANAETALQQLEAGLSAAGGGSGKLGGSIANTLGGLGLNDSASSYNDLLQSYLPVILQALGKSDAPSESEQKGILKALPAITDSPTVANEKLRNLRTRIAAAQQNTQLYSGGSQTDLASVLGSL